MMEKKTIGIGIIGCGTISKAHIEAIKSCSELKLIGVTDKNVELATSLSSQHNCTLFENSIDLITDSRIQFVVLLTPPAYHEELVTTCALHGRHILAEKPVGVDLTKIKTYVDLCDERGVVFSVVSQHRFDSSTVLLKQKLDQNMFGKLTGANCIVNWYRDQSYYNSWHRFKNMAGGGVLTIQAIHTIDLMLWCLGEVESVQAYINRSLGTDIDVEDTAMVCLKFKNGALGVISATTSAYPGYPTRLDIFGRDGSMTIEGDVVTFYQSRKEQHVSIASALKGETVVDHGAISITSLTAQYLDVVQAILTGASPLVSGRVAAQTFSVIEAIYESAGRGEEITV